MLFSGKHTAAKLAGLSALLSAVVLIPLTLAADDGDSRQTSPSAGMMRYPDVSADNIVFVYAGDLWVVPRQGGIASPLASPSGEELFPRFSPDGSQIAFVGNYEGGQDIYVVSTAGGPSQRVTYHPDSELLCDWTPDGKLLYSTNGFAGLGRQPQLFEISKSEPLPTQLPVPYGTNGAISPDGQWLAYTPHSRDNRTWKRYRGGMASDIWLFNLQTNQSRQVTTWEGTDTLPMWSGNRVFYLSDAGPEHRLNIWSYDIESEESKQVTDFDEYDCKFPSIGPGADGQGEIVVQNGSQLWLVGLRDGSRRAVEIAIPGDRPKLRPQKIDAAEFVEDGDISPSGKRLVVEARGDIWSLPAEKGSARNMTRTNGVAERMPSWSPDGRWIAYFSDATGEYELYIMQSDGREEARQLTRDGTHYRFSPTWSPDSKWIAFTDKAGAIWLHSIDNQATRQVDVDPYANQPDLAWSNDSAWLAYTKTSDDKGAVSSIWAYNLAEDSKQQLTSSFFSDGNPAFDRKGDYLYFTSSRSFDSPRYEDVGTTFIYSGTEVVLAVPLRADVTNPLLPKSDEESWEDAKEKGEEDDGDKDANNESDREGDSADASDTSEVKSENQDQASTDQSDDDADDDAGKEQDKTESKEPVKIEFAGINERTFQLPIKPGSFAGLAVNDKGQLIYARGSSRGSEEKPVIQLFDPADDEKEEQTVVDGASQFTISANGKKLLVLQQGDRAFIVDAAKDQKLEKPVSTEGMTVMVDPRAEWKQVFTDAWRIMRDYFYDPTMHGVDWPGMRKHYETLLDDCTSRADVGFVIGEMIAELNVGHAYYRPNRDPDRGPDGSVGLLGCRFEAQDGRYKIAELFEGAAWDTDAPNPLRQAGVNEGEFILAVNGVPLTADQNPYSVFQDMGGATITLSVSKDAVEGDDRDVVIEALSNDSNLRFRAWIEDNRRIVDERTSGRVGYIYVINTGVPGQNDLFRQFYGQINKEALIIDDRWNGGGQIPTRFIELLNRPVTNYWATRDGNDWTWPPDAHHGPKCMLINGMAGSGGDMFPALFRQAGLGKLIGMRTWGGLVGISGNPGMIDGSSVTAPTFAFYESDGTWGIEGHGVDPDIRVVDDPAKMVDGGDPQLEAAIAHIMQELKTGAYVKPNRPKYPDRSKFGLKDEDK